ncbi:ABC transporter permease [Flavobacteriaceae bacterium F08102]|nr:ABC transporter permease [Flavobacteriaceae bacterium F08102]
MSFPLYIAKRYLFSKSGNNAINIITLIATVGVIVGAIALFIVLSVFSGLKEFSLNFIKVADPDLKVSVVEGKSFEFTNELARQLDLDQIVSYSKVVEERAFFSFKDKPHIANIKGVDEQFLNVNNIDTAIYVGEWLDPDLVQSAVLGNGVSIALSLGPYDFEEPLKVTVPRPGKGYMNNPKRSFSQLNLQPIGVFRLTEDMDKKFVFVHLAFAQELLNYKPNQISAVELKLKPDANVSAVIDLLKDRLGPTFKIQTRAQLNAVFHRMLNTENLVSYLVFTLILIIALFNVIGAMVMMILDKKENLRTLFNLGATLGEIKQIFVFQGFLLSLVGLFIGLSLAIPFVLIQKKFGFILINETLAYPIEFKWFNLLIVILTIVALGYLAAKIASARINDKLIKLQ